MLAQESDAARLALAALILAWLKRQPRAAMSDPLYRALAVGELVDQIKNHERKAP